jgi:hypothetical protein
MMAMMADTVDWYPRLLWFWGTTTDVWRVRLISARAARGTAGLRIRWGNLGGKLNGKLDVMTLLEVPDEKPGDAEYRGEAGVAQ